MTQTLPDETSLLLLRLTVIYNVAALAVLSACGNLSVLLQSRFHSQVRAFEDRRQATADTFYKSFFVRCLGVTRRHWKALGSLVYMTLVVVPCMLYTATLFGGGALALAEGWLYRDGFLYIWQDVFGLGPYVSLRPQSVLGVFLDHYVNLFVFVLTQIVLGFCGGLRIVDVVQDLTANSTFGFLRIVFIHSPLALALICFCQALSLTWLEGWDVRDSMGFVIGNLCDVQAGLTDDQPSRAASLFMCSQFIGITMAASGIVIQVVGCHPLVTKFVDHVNDKGLPVVSPKMWRRSNGPPDEIKDAIREEADPEQGAADTTGSMGAKRPPQPLLPQPQEEHAMAPGTVDLQLRTDSEEQALELQKPRLNSPLSSPLEEQDAEIQRLRLALEASQQRELQLQRELRAARGEPVEEARLTRNLPAEIN